MITISDEDVQRLIKALAQEDYQADAKRMTRNLELIDFKVLDPSRYPHKCPICNSPAYLGANVVECSNTSCKHWKKGV